jgi:tRNA threonylcarbamoyladenosine biosynthesis protein TsaE
MRLLSLPHVLIRDWPDEAATTAAAAQLARCPGLNQALIVLNGDLGAGKTTFVRGLLRALGATGRIKSPSYAVLESYALPGLQAHHFDFYRFTDPREWEDAGFRELLTGPGLKLVEWAGNAPGLMPAADLALDIEPHGDGRRVQAQALTETGAQLLEAWA